MNSCYIIIIVVVVFIILMLIFNCFCPKNRNQDQIQQFKQIQNVNGVTGYADVNDPYDRPFIINNLISLEKCRDIINHSRDKLMDSQVVGGIYKNIRNSKQHWISKYDPLVKPIFEQVSRMFQIPIENAEDLQVVRYLPDQYYNEHHDACCDMNDKCNEFVRKGGQRKLTVLIYLNNEFTEGNTYFKNLNLKLKPSPGSAIVFFPLAKNSSKCHPLSLHAGLPVKSGEKWIANIWFRERQF